MHITFFKNLWTSVGTPQQMSLKELFEAHCKTPKICAKKNSSPLFALTSFRDNTRHADTAEAFSGVVLDFDNDDEQKKCIPNPDTPDTVADNLAGFEFALYTSYSHTPEHPKFRVLLPFSSELASAQWEQVFDRVVELLGNPEGLDLTCRDRNRFYYVAACPKESAEFFYSEYAEGAPLDVADLLGAPATAPRRQSRKTLGRNNALKAQASACLMKGISLEQTIAELVAYDKANHQPPLFEDPAEHYLPGCPEAGAMQFVSRIWFSHARNHGDLPRIVKDETFAPDPAEICEKKPPIDERLALPDELARRAPGIVGEIAAWITETAQKAQPALSLGAALCAVGTLKAHRVQTETGLRTNLYILGLGPSGSGKEHPARMVQMLFEETGNGLLLSGEPASDSALLKSIKQNKGRTLICWDEIGHAIVALTSRHAPVHERKIIKVLTQMFTKAQGRFLGKEYATVDSRGDIEQPCLSIFGTTVAPRFYEALSSRDALDGFLPRWLVFSVEHPDIPRQKKKFVEEVPVNLLESVAGLCGLPTNVRAKGNVDRVNKVRPDVVRLDPDALEFANECERYFEEKKIASRKEGAGLDAIWNRGFEHTLKIALTVSLIRIDKAVLQWSFDLIDHCLKASIEAFQEHCVENFFDKENKRILDIVRRCDGISQSTLYRKAKLPTNDLRKYLEFLNETGQIRFEEGTTAGRPVRRWYVS